MKAIAFYLPQFHTIPENDAWWGKGFTEWVNVRKAKPLFAGHLQPRLPLYDNYYDLSRPQTLRSQARLMNEYNVYGMCFYHYWFAGKLLLEKPAELLLANPDIPMNFCFSWANEPWSRSWDGKKHQIIMPQAYGSDADWRKHFDYLLPFFKDPRYIKEDNCPMFLIYKPQDIKCLSDMMAQWEQLARRAGFNGMHFVDTLRGPYTELQGCHFKAHVEFEPVRTNMQQPPILLNYKRLRRYWFKLVNRVFSTHILLNKPFPFAEVANRSLLTPSPEGTYGGVFAGWDNSPRRGIEATIILPPTRDEFRNYLKAKIEQTSGEYHTDYIFINAWNEWAEGAVLEPDWQHGDMYLSVIKEVLS